MHSSDFYGFPPLHVEIPPTTLTVTGLICISLVHCTTKRRNYSGIEYWRYQTYQHDVMLLHAVVCQQYNH